VTKVSLVLVIGRSECLLSFPDMRAEDKDWKDLLTLFTRMIQVGSIGKITVLLHDSHLALLIEKESPDTWSNIKEKVRVMGKGEIYTGLLESIVGALPG